MAKGVLHIHTYTRVFRCVCRNFYMRKNTNPINCIFLRGLTYTKIKLENFL